MIGGGRRLKRKFCIKWTTRPTWRGCRAIMNCDECCICIAMITMEYQITNMLINWINCGVWMKMKNEWVTDGACSGDERINCPVRRWTWRKLIRNRPEWIRKLIPKRDRVKNNTYRNGRLLIFSSAGWANSITGQ